MSNGEISKTDKANINTSLLLTMLDGASGVNTKSLWMENKFTKVASLHVDSINSDAFTVQLRGSNKPDLPEDTDIGFQIGNDISTAGLTAVSVLSRWVRVVLTAHTPTGGLEETAAVNSYLHTVQ